MTNSTTGRTNIGQPLIPQSLSNRLAVLSLHLKILNTKHKTAKMIRPRSLFLVPIFLLCIGQVNLFAQLSPVPLGRASNIFSILTERQNQVYASDTHNLVAFIHRQDTAIWGGPAEESGKFRYDISIDGGNTFQNDIGILNDDYKELGRYPQITGYNLINSDDPLMQRFIWNGATLRSGNWLGMVSGVSTVDTSSSTFSTSEHYDFEDIPTQIPGGLCQGLPGEFWSVVSSNGGQLGDSIIIQKGVYNSLEDTIAWSVHQIIEPNHYTGFSGNIRMISPNMSFSPDGSIGWIAFLGDLQGGADSTFNPIFILSTDGGATWGNPIEVDLRTMDYVSDSQSLFDELRAPDPITSTGRPTCSFEFDITVDKYGRPHLFVVLGSASTIANPDPGYTVFSELTKIGVDIFTDDGGLSWKALKVSPIYRFRGTFGTGDPQIMDNRPQISRTIDGSNIFYAWTDSDTLVTSGGSNTAPNLVIASQRIDDGFMTCPKWVTLGDATWDGKMLWPTMAPEVLENINEYKLPIVSAELLTGNTLESTQFWYFGNDAVIDKNEYLANYTVFDANSCLIRCEEVIDDAAYEFNVCGLDVTFSDTTKSLVPITSWFWDFGDGNTSTMQSPQHSYTAAGSYSVCLTIVTSCGVDSICKTIITCYPPIANFTYAKDGKMVTLTNSSSLATSYQWDFGDGNTSTMNNPIHTYTANGNYTIFLIAINSCKNDTTFQFIQVCDLPEGIVQNTNDDGCGSLRRTVANASSGDTIRFDASIDGMPILLDSQIVLDKNLVILGNDTTNTVIDGQQMDRIFEIQIGDTVMISGMTLQNGNAGERFSPNDKGGAILNYGFLKLLQCKISNNQAYESGGGISNFNILIIHGSSIINNQTAGSPLGCGGGIANYHTEDSLSIVNSIICDNTALNNASGGGFYNGGTCTVQNSKVLGNTATVGGGIANFHEIAITNSSFSGNSAIGVLGVVGVGGGFFNSAGTAFFNNSTIAGNAALNGFSGGGISSLGSVTLTNSIVTKNSDDGSGPDIFKEGGTVVNNSYNLIGDNGSVEIEFPNGPLVGIDPLFVMNVGNSPVPNKSGNLQLTICSPAINGGNNLGLGINDSIDLLGQPRIDNGIVDLGAYEFQHIAPVANCQDITVQLDATGTASISSADIDNGSDDPCGTAILSLDKTLFSCADVGTNAVILTVTDNNQMAACTSTVTVEDHVTPVAICQDLTVQLDATGTASITTADIDNGSNDACGIASLSLDKTSFSCNDVGANSIILTVTDNNNLMATCTSTVTVEDNVAPVAVCLDITVQLDATGTASITPGEVDNGSSDACGIQTLILDKTDFTCADIGDNPVMLTVRDINGNAATCNATVTVSGIPISNTANILGLSPFCPGMTNIPYSTITHPNVISYNWSYSGTGVTIHNNNSSSITIDFSGSATSGTLTVEYVTSCGPSGIKDNFSIVKASAFTCSLTLACPENLWVINAMIDFPGGVNLFKANSNVLSAATIETDQTVLFRSGQEVNLLPYFEVELGALFTAEIQGCQEALIDVREREK